MNITPLNKVLETLIGNIPDAMRLSSRFCDKAGTLDFLAPLLIRLYLVPVFWMAGTKSSPVSPIRRSGSAMPSGDWGCRLLMCWCFWWRCSSWSAPCACCSVLRPGRFVCR